jgi:hypothetical protein
VAQLFSLGHIRAMKRNHFAYWIWAIGTVLIVLSWFGFVSPIVGWIGFAVSLIGSFMSFTGLFLKGGKVSEERSAEMARQSAMAGEVIAAAKARQPQRDELLEKSRQNYERYAKVLDKWEEQQRRMDAILTKWEQMK